MEYFKPGNGRIDLYFDSLDVLHCPHCGGNNLHHEIVTVYSRKEDADQTLETRVAGRIAECAIVPSKISLNPSSRRDGVSITFSCEGCPSRLELTLAQHKGETFIEWRRPRRRVAA